MRRKRRRRQVTAIMAINGMILAVTRNNVDTNINVYTHMKNSNYSLNNPSNSRAAPLRHGRFQKLGLLIWNPNSRALIIRTPTKRDPQFIEKAI